MPSHYSRLNNMQLAASNNTPNENGWQSPLDSEMERSFQQMPIIDQRTGTVNRPQQMPRGTDFGQQGGYQGQVYNIPQQSLTQNMPYVYDPSQNIDPKSFVSNMPGVAPKSLWKNFENLQPSDGGPPNPGRSLQFLKDMAELKMKENQSMQQQRRQQHPLSKFREMLFPE